MNNIIEIHQFSPSARVGDGITNGMLYFQSLLKELGFITHIYAENFDKELEDRVFHISKFNKNKKNQVLFIHYSIYYDFEPFLNQIKARKFMIYHNITPAHFFPKDSFLYQMCKRGREYLPEIKNFVEASICDSQLNAQELLELGFDDVRVIPILADLDKIKQHPWNYKLFDEKVEEFNIIFVGRIAKNKAQDDLIKVINYYRRINPLVKLYLIGGTTDETYRNYLKELIKENQLENNVFLTGKISNEDLYAYYKAADIFLCLSEHEGFGIPLIESFLFNLPVIAYNSSNIKYTLNGGGVLVYHKDYKKIAAMIELIRTNKALKREILKTEKEALKIYSKNSIVKNIISFLEEKEIKVPNKNVTQTRKKEIRFQFEGPFDSSYSLATVNRLSALTFEKYYPKEVSLFATEGFGDYKANEDYLKTYPKAFELYKRGEKAKTAYVVFRNLYPPRVSGMKGIINLLNSYGWEESSFPREYVENFNKYLDGVTVMSSYVKNVLRANGVLVPMTVAGLGVEHLQDIKPKPLELKIDKKFKFLHISSCFPRKGVDVLLKAYTQAFNKNDDVVLIIKTFPNPHHNIEKDIQEIQKNNNNAPKIVLINQDLNDEQIRWLYQICDILVSPSRGEGFNLPVAEAMLLKKPVIVTGYGGHMDFCNDKTATLIDYSFQKANTHLNLFNSYWAEPSQEHLKELLQEFYSNHEKFLQKTDEAYKTIINNFQWKNYFTNTTKLISYLEKEPIFTNKKIKLAWVSSFNTKCGIATYSEFILQELSKERFDITIFANYSTEVIDENKEKNVIRCWKDRFDKSNKKLINAILEKESDEVVINFNFGFFSTSNLEEIITELSKHNIKITIIFHSVADVTIKGLEASLKEIKNLNKVNNILVHNIEDLNFFKNLNLSNMELLPHGVKERKVHLRKKNFKKEKFIISSFGFLLPHKGILELIEAFYILSKKYSYVELLLVNALYPVKESKEYLAQVIQKIKDLKIEDKVELIYEFLSDEEAYSYLDKADIIVMPYRKTNESASGAIRYALSTYKPVVCTPQYIFNDVADIVFFTKGFDSKDIALKIEEFLKNPKLLKAHFDRQLLWVKEHSWQHIALRLSGILLNHKKE